MQHDIECTTFGDTTDMFYMHLAPRLKRCLNPARTIASTNLHHHVLQILVASPIYRQVHARVDGQVARSLAMIRHQE